MCNVCDIKTPNYVFIVTKYSGMEHFQLCSQFLYIHVTTFKVMKMWDLNIHSFTELQDPVQNKTAEDVTVWFKTKKLEYINVMGLSSVLFSYSYSAIWTHT